MELDPQRILSELGFSRTPDKVTPVTGGWDTTLWRVDSQGRSFALRVFRVEQARTSQREAVVMRALSEQGLPVPALRAEGVGQGRPALLLDWCPGRTVMEELTARPWRIWRLGVEMGRMHARIGRRCSGGPGAHRHADATRAHATWISTAGRDRAQAAARSRVAPRLP